MGVHPTEGIGRDICIGIFGETSWCYGIFAVYGNGELMFRLCRYIMNCWRQICKTLTGEEIREMMLL